MSDTPTYEIALSFAGEDRPYVAQVAAYLQGAGVNVFYDEYHRASLWGKNLYDHLTTVYQSASAYTLLFASQHYARKVWTNLERQSAQARALAANHEVVLPARFDDTDIPGLLPTTHYIDLRVTAPDELGALVLEKLGRNSIAIVPPDRAEAILALIVRLQAATISTSQCVAEALTIARTGNHTDLVRFCTNELIGYPESKGLESSEPVPWRHLTAYCGTAKLNLTALGYRGIPVMAAIEQAGDAFVEKYLILREPVARIESRDAAPNPKGCWHQTLPIRLFVDDPTDSDTLVNCYSRAEAYRTVLIGIRGELTKRLAALLALGTA